MLGFPINWCDLHRPAAQALSKAIGEENSELIERLLRANPFLEESGPGLMSANLEDAPLQERCE